jgi:lysozyme
MSWVSRAIQQIQQDEGLVLHAYQDHLGFWTIGHGRLVDQRRGGGISQTEAMMLLRNDVDRVLAQIRQRAPAFDSLPEHAREALTNMAFQLGVDGLLRFKRMWAAIEKRDFAAARDHALDSKWAQQTPARARRVADLLAGPA